jgi:hypothetical protein
MERETERKKKGGVVEQCPRHPKKRVTTGQRKCSIRHCMFKNGMSEFLSIHLD